MPRPRKEPQSEETTSRRRPGSTPEDREAQMIDLADQLAERQLREGSASAQVITHYLKLGSSRERLEQQKLALERDLVKAKTDQIAGMQRQEEMFADAIKAMRSYQGVSEPESHDEGYYEAEEYE